VIVPLTKHWEPTPGSFVLQTAGGERVHVSPHPNLPGHLQLGRYPNGSTLPIFHPLFIVRPPKRTGLGQVTGSDFWSALASAIQQVEGYYPPGTPGYPTGSLAYRNNNPGNIRYPGSLAVGATGGNEGYAVFPNFQTGENALLGLEQSPLYVNDTLVQFFQTYAPGADGNNPAAYAATVASNLGVDANTPISQLAAGTAAPDDSGDDGSGDDSSASSSDASSSLSDALGGVSPVALGVIALAIAAVAVLS
jgi:hypothetical protein